MYLLELVHNIALVVALSAIFPLVARRWGVQRITTRVASGVLFGAVVLTGMLTPVDLGAGVVFDGRTVVLCAAGVLGGPVVAGIAAFIAIAYRIVIGGGGVYTGVATIVSSAAMGVAFYYARRRDPRIVTPARLYGLGLAVHIVMVGLMSGLPGGLGSAAIEGVVGIVLTLYPIATAVVCWILLQEEGRLASAEALARSEEQLKLAIEASDLGLWDWDLVTGEVRINDRWAGMLGYSVKDLAPVTYETWRALVHPDDLADAEAREDRHIAGVTPFYGRHIRLRHRTGRWVWVSSRGKITKRDGAGKPLRMTGTHVDITAQKSVECALYESKEKLERMVLDVAATMGKIVEARDPYTQGHQQRVAKLARAIAEEMRLSANEVDGIEMAGLLHDIGKLTVPAEILTKPGVLSPAEFALIKEHPAQGFSILRDIAFPWPIAEMVLQHHERIDGSGYPAGMVGADILPAARILAVADTVEAMASHRPYRPSKGIEAALAEVTGHPQHYDVEAAAACMRLFESGRIPL
jgi:PAS domain S-box-containing protein/putative nucleotidyltransferase with HDIG domain